MKRDIDKEPYGKLSIFFYLGLTFISGVFLLGFSSSLISQSKLVEPALDKSLCKTYKTMDKWIQARNVTDNWIGTARFDIIS